MAEAAPAPAPEKEFVTITVASHDGSAFTFKLNAASPLKKMFEVFCSKTGLSRQHTRFFFDGQRISDEQSPKSLDMTEGDRIDATVEQTGGF